MVSLQEQDQSAIISKAFNRAWAVLINKHKTEPIPEFYKKDEMKLNFIEIYKHIYSTSNGDINFMKHWFNVINKDLNCTPHSLCFTEKGLLIVLAYLELRLRK